MSLIPVSSLNSSSAPCSSAQAANGSSSSIGPMCLFVKEHGKNLMEKLNSLKCDQNLTDLRLDVQNKHFNVHKVVMAASSKFFKVSKSSFSL